MNFINSIYELIGNTPLIRLNSFSTDTVTLFAKLEYMNPGGSIKDRLGIFLLNQLINTEIINSETTIIEATAGNTGIGLALASRKHGMQLIVCVPEKFSQEKQALMKALGATIIVTPTEDGMEGAIKKATELYNSISNSYFINQFKNDLNPLTYFNTLGPEIYEQLNGNIQILIAGAGSGGTFTGIAQYLKSKNKMIKTVVVEPVGSILNGGNIQSHKVEGIGMNTISPFMDVSLFDAIHTISDDESFYYVKKLALLEGLLVGGSSGAAMAAAVKEAKHLKEGNIVMIFPDSSERYLSQNIYGN